MNTKISSSESTSSSSPKRDVFLSFMEETGKSFTDHLYYALNQKRINTFKEDRQTFGRGRDISEATLEAIQESRLAIVVLSKNYASSTWCLDQLAKIVTCNRDLGLRDHVHPVFYHVDQIHVREQTGDFGKAFQQVFKGDNMEKVNQWREVLTQIANLPGWDLQNKHESNFIQEIVKDVSEKLNPTFEDGDNNLLVGMDSRMKKMYSLLDMERLDDVRTIGIWGMGGIGKTTIAREAFKRLSDKFEATAFVANVREIFGNNDIIHLQEYLHQNLWGIKDALWNDFMRINLLKNAMRSKRVLVILDDVDSLNQIEDLVGHWRNQRDWLGPGSRVIVTSRNKHLLRKYGEKYIYEVDKLTKDEALQLLCQEAPFNENTIPDESKSLFDDLVEYADGHPLALNKLVDNSFLDWSDSLAELKEDIFSDYLVPTFKASYDGLDGEDKEIFLEIASSFNGEDRYGVEKKLQGHSKISIQVLIEKSLIAMIRVPNMTTDTFSTPPKYDVFLSFSEETSKSFTDHLYCALNKKGINTFKEDDEIVNKRSKAIEESRFAIVVLSKAYVTSIWCLEELAEIVERKEKLKMLQSSSSSCKRDWDIVYPVFYHVDTSEIRKQKGFVGEVFEKHEQVFKYTKEKVIKWRKALSQVANLGGWDLLHRHESDFIQEIVKDISKNLKRFAFACGTNNDLLVGMNSRMNKMDLLLNLNLNEVRTVVICGKQGIGKTAIAIEVFKRISHKFDACAFISNIRRVFKNDQISLRRHLCQVLLDSELERTMKDDDMSLDKLMKRLESKRVLIVLDDVDQFEQIEGLVGNWEKEDQVLGRGSRIVVTTRENYLSIRYGKQNIYEVDKLTKKEALQLLWQEAFEDDRVLVDYTGVSNSVIEYADGDASTLKNLGSFLFGRTVDEWSYTIAKLKDPVARQLSDSCSIAAHSRTLLPSTCSLVATQSCYSKCPIYHAPGSAGSIE
ncbi:hypothetical protein FNV43_RR27124 [Rhamnella rubrinervis]|uniref:TIR domain-containing protein n=1 Tax=Rhamnella rubrinervis TaxID=2594499 RepID=A0A8K0GN75_9ROSA|nr:hypothetical protein FNV43_RR27124 [Rhamnella rubrinervis]